MLLFSPDDSDENERTVTEDKQVDQSLLSDEGLEVSVILSDNQGSLDVQNDETVVGKSLGCGYHTVTTVSHRKKLPFDKIKHKITFNKNSVQKNDETSGWQCMLAFP